MQSADPEHPFIEWVGIAAWLQHSWIDFTTASESIAAWSQSPCADATTTSEAIASSPDATKVPAIGSIARDRATKNANMVRPMCMELLAGRPEYQSDG